MVVRYDIEELFDSYVPQSICVLDVLQGEGSINDAIYFNGLKPECSINQHT